MAIIRFETNIPQNLHMRVLEAKQVESQFGGMQHMFSAQEGAFYVSAKVGAILSDQFRLLGVKPGDPIEIVKAETGRGPERRIQWTVSMSLPAAATADLAVSKLRASAPAEPPSELEQQLEASIRMVEARKLVASAAPAQPAWASFLVEQSNALIDAYSKVLTHASQYPNVRGEDVRSIFLSTFINVSKGQRNVA